MTTRRLFECGSFVVLLFGILGCGTTTDRRDIPAKSTAAAQNPNRPQPKQLLRPLPTVQKTVPAVIPERKGASSEPWLVLAFGLSAITTLIAVVTSFYLYEWRRLLLNSPHRVLPESWGNYWDNLRENVSNLNTTIAPAVRQLDTRTTQHSKLLDDVLETTMKLQGALDQRDADIRRLREGYDEEIFRRFLLRFVRVDQTVRQFSQELVSAPKELGQISRLLEDALEECGVERFSPEIGEDSRSASGVADNPKVVETDDGASDHKIAEVIDAGYRLARGGQSSVIVPAKVSIFLSNR
jgi:hypothetical protein